MLYRTFPKIQDEPISVLGFGLMRLPQTLSHTLDYALIKNMISLAAESGVNYFDTAYPYHNGESEAVLGNALCELGIRDNVYIADKMPVWLIREKADLQKIFDTQLERLKTDRIDFYLLHALDRARWEAVKSVGGIEFLQKLKESEKIRHIGFSFHDEYEAFTRIIDEFPDWEFCQLQYNYLNEDAQAGVKGIEYAATRNIGVVVMESLCGGLLANPPKGVRDIFASADKPRMPAEWALRWVLENQNVVCALSGMSSPYQLTMNAATASAAKPNSLPRSQLETVKKAAAWFKNRIKVPCTQCGYCMPCAENVKIGAIFAEWNNRSFLGEYEDEEDAAAGSCVCAKNDETGGTNGAADSVYGVGGKKAKSDVYRALVSEKADASKCIGCRVCEQGCPQHLPIAELLQQARRDLE